MTENQGLCVCVCVCLCVCVCVCVRVCVFVPVHAFEMKNACAPLGVREVRNPLTDETLCVFRRSYSDPTEQTSHTVH